MQAKRDSIANALELCLSCTTHQYNSEHLTMIGCYIGCRIFDIAWQWQLLDVGQTINSQIHSIPCVDTLRPRQNGWHFTDDIFKCIFLDENIWISIKLSLKFVCKGKINNIPVLVQIMTCCRPGDKSLSEPMMVSLPLHICITKPQRVKCYPMKYVSQVFHKRRKLLFCKKAQLYEGS